MGENSPGRTKKILSGYAHPMFPLFNARLAKDVEEYYRTMFRGRVSSWNLRDRHMARTLEALVARLEREGGGTKVVVWAHNSHVGDARATSMGARVNSTSVNSCANAMTAKLCWLVLAHPLVPSQPYRIGVLLWNASAFVLRSWAVMKRSFARPGCQISYSRTLNRTGRMRSRNVQRFFCRLREAA